jgi:hypothetical protein
MKKLINVVAVDGTQPQAKRFFYRTAACVVSEASR